MFAINIFCTNCFDWVSDVCESCEPALRGVWPLVAWAYAATVANDNATATVPVLNQFCFIGSSFSAAPVLSGCPIIEFGARHGHSAATKGSAAGMGHARAMSTH